MTPEERQEEINQLVEEEYAAAEVEGCFKPREVEYKIHISIERTATNSENL